MNLFCFTLEGSTDSIYEPAYGQTLKEPQHKCHCSPARLRRRSEWGGSAPSISADQPQSPAKSKQDIRRSCMVAPTMEKESLEKDTHSYRMSSGDKMTKKAQSSASSQNSVLTREETMKDLIPERTPTNLPAQHGESTAEDAEAMQTTGRLKKLQNLVQAKKGHQSNSEKVKNTNEQNEVVRNNNGVLTCIGLGRRTEKKSSKSATRPQQLHQHHNKALHEDPEEEQVWSPKMETYQWRPLDCPESWTPFYHTCQRTQHELWACGGGSFLPPTSEWDRFESLIKELESRQSDMCLPHMIRSITDLHFPQFPQKPEQNCEPTKPELERTEVQTPSQRDGKHIKFGEDMQRDDTAKSEPSSRKTSNEGQRRSRNSLESLYSLKSGQSSSSGVTSGSDCSSNRGSLRLDDDLLLTRPFCGRARVHTEFVPSPYDTESLKLKVGDVIDIIAKPPMGIWKGILDGRVGNFKFIYVDVLTEQSLESHIHGVRHKSAVREMLKRLSLEEYSLLLQSSGYQTVDDLMRLSERDLMELNVTDPEHKQRLLAAVNSLQQLYSDSTLENEVRRSSEISSEDTKADMNNCPRDSGCLITSDSPDDCTDDPDPRFSFVPADMS